mmetsp:Transcript_45123/g.79412  ORF Transcript_45123/g.79412 Transcript_45123/m.79412 type:complete len:400 (+) Transcript_45123:49-1248(+)
MCVAGGWHVKAASRSTSLLSLLAFLCCTVGEATKSANDNLAQAWELAEQCVGKPRGLNAATLLQVHKPQQSKKKAGKKKKPIAQPYVDPPDEQEVPDVTPLAPETLTVNHTGMTRERTSEFADDPEQMELEAAIDKYSEAAENATEQPLDIYEAAEKAENESAEREVAYRSRSGAMGDPVLEMKHKEEHRKLQEAEAEKAADEMVRQAMNDEAESRSRAEALNVGDVNSEVETATAERIAKMKETAATAVQFVPGSAKIWKAVQERLPGAYGLFNPTDTTTQAPSTTPKPYCPEAGQRCSLIMEFTPGDEAEKYNSYLYSYDQISNMTKFERSNSYILDFGTSRPKQCCQVYTILKANPEVVWIKMDVPIYPGTMVLAAKTGKGKEKKEPKTGKGKKTK